MVARRRNPPGSIGCHVPLSRRREMNRNRLSWIVAVVVGIGVAALALGGGARADEGDANGGMPAFQKKIDHPLAKALVGTWKVTHKSMHGDATGTTKFALGVGDTVVL